MDKRLFDVLHGREENYLLPFYWQHGDHTDKIPEQIQMIYDSGCRAFCVEARPHPEFAKDGWWRDMDIIFSEAKKRDMQVWLLDDYRCPTGYANGLVPKKYPHLRQWVLAERHVDVVGPMKDGAICADGTSEDHILLGAFAYKRERDEKQSCDFEAIDLTHNISNGYLYWDVPEGVWRIYFYYKTRQGGHPVFIDMINKDSVAVLIEAVYEPHFEHYKEYFGNTFAGFFSDEPCFANNFKYSPEVICAGTPNIALPWNERVREMMAEHLGYDPLPHLNLLWFEDNCNGDDQAEIRYSYMDAITKLYSECFTKQLSDWCHDHGIMYIGHVIEQNCLCAGAGHYFRALKWQDMSGIDIVLHQVMPGMDDFLHTASCTFAPGSAKFYHYVLAKLGASLAHIEPGMKGRAMCEVFGAYGWAEDTTVMKYLIDYLLVRGINYFVPHAFDTKFPDPDCPPHFGIEGRDPSFDGFGALMKYTNKASHILYDTEHVCKIAVLYYMENIWSSRRNNAMTLNDVAKNLYDAHFDFDIVPFDYLGEEKVTDEKLAIEKESFECLIVPYADHIAEEILDCLSAMSRKGLRVIFVNAMPENAEFEGTVVALDDLANEMRALGLTDVSVEAGFEKLRILHNKRDGNDVFMFANEERKRVTTTVKLPCSGDYVRLDLANDVAVGGSSENGELKLDLLPNQSQIIVFGDNSSVEKEFAIDKTVDCSPKYRLDLAYCDDMTNFAYAGDYDSFFNVTGASFRPDFSGMMRYSFDIDIECVEKHVFLDLGRVGQNARVMINGKDCGIRFTAPYIFDITKSVNEGKNSVVVTVGNTLVQKVRDRFSKSMLIAPSGLLGDITIKYSY